MRERFFKITASGDLKPLDRVGLQVQIKRTLVGIYGGILGHILLAFFALLILFLGFSVLSRIALRMANVKFKVKKGDTVKIIAGDDKGKTGKILSVLAKKGQVIVEGCKVAKKAIKPSEKTPNGGFINKEMPIDISNVAKVEG